MAQETHFGGEAAGKNQQSLSQTFKEEERGISIGWEDNSAWPGANEMMVDYDGEWRKPGV